MNLESFNWKQNYRKKKMSMLDTRTQEEHRKAEREQMSHYKKYHVLVELCEEYFVNAMVQQYAGANTECRYCGEREDNHQEYCPVYKYSKVREEEQEDEYRK